MRDISDIQISMFRGQTDTNAIVYKGDGGIFEIDRDV